MFGTIGRATLKPGQEALLGTLMEDGVPVEFVARSHFPMLEYATQLELMQQLADEVAPHV